MSTEQLHRDLGRVEGKLGGLSTKVDNMDLKLDEALSYIQRQRGARKATIAIGSGLGAVFGFVASFIAQAFLK